MNAAVEGIITIDSKGMIQSINSAGVSIFGYSQSELMNKNVKILMPSAYQEEHDNYILNYLSSGTPKIIGTGRAVVGMRKNGQEFPMWLSIGEFSENDKQYFVGIVSDKSVEKSNLQKAISYESILEHSLNEIYLFNKDSLKFIHVNQGALQNLQYSQEEMLLKTPVDIKPDFTDAEFHKTIRPLINDDIDKLVFSTHHQRKDGSQYPVEVHLEIIEFEYQLVFVAIIIDISERVAAQEKERMNEEQLAHMDRISMFGELAAGISHEINQPLTAISTYANAGIQRLETENFDVIKVKQLLEKINTASNKASDVIIHLREMLRPKSKEIDHLNINEIIQEAIDLIKIDTRATKFKFKLQLSNNMPEILGDSVQLQQVILNLLRNSMDASNEEEAEEQEIIISTEELTSENRIKVSIKDFGCGVSPDIENNLFTPFQTTKKSGMGIGLSICQSIIQSHNGRLWYTKNTNKGATFHFTVLTTLGNDHE